MVHGHVSITPCFSPPPQHFAMEAWRHVTNVIFFGKLLIQSKVDPRFQMNIYICDAHIHFLCFFQSAHIEAFLQHLAEFRCPASFHPFVLS